MLLTIIAYNLCNRIYDPLIRKSNYYCKDDDDDWLKDKSKHKELFEIQVGIIPGHNQKNRPAILPNFLL